MSRQEIKERAWQKMEHLLDTEMPHRRPIFMVLLPYAASFLLLFTIASLFLFNQKNAIEYSQSSSPIDITAINYPPSNFFKDQKIRKDVNHFKTNAAVQKTTVNNSALNIENNQLLLPEGNNTETLITPTNTSVGKKLTSSLPTVVIQKEIINREDSNSETFIAKNDAISVTENKNPSTAITKDTFISNQEERKVFLLTNDIKKTFNPIEDMGLTTSGSIGFVSDNFDEYGLRLGFELQKPVTNNLNLNTGLRYSVYDDQYASTYQTSTPVNLLDNSIITRMNERNVSRSFIELPVYADYEVNNNLKLKTGASLTYNKNTSDSPGFSSQAILNNNLIPQSTKNEIGKLYADENGYLGEFLIGATLNIDKIALDVEATRGFISNQDIDDRNVVGMRLSYKFGN